MSKMRASYYLRSATMLLVARCHSSSHPTTFVHPACDKRASIIRNMMALTTSSSPKRIFCYGDSLTAGTSPPLDQLFPYGPHLEQELNNLCKQPPVSTSSSSSSSLSSFEPESAVVRWRGLPGWTASAMAEYMDDSTIGLRSALDSIRNPSLSLVIILAGTNDIGSVTSSSSMYTTECVRLVVDPILRLHNTCLGHVGDSGKKDVHTLIIGIPGSAWQQMNSQAARLCSDVNGALKQFASTYSSEEGERKRRRVQYIDFPFSYQRDDNKWCGDGLHLSPEGYKTLGTSLAPCVKEMLDEMRLMGVEE